MASSFTLLAPPINHQSTSSQTPGNPLPLSTSFLVYCGRGDKKTAKGKPFNHSFGKARPGDKNKGKGAPRIPVPSSPSFQPPKRDKFEDDEVVKIDLDYSLF